MIDYQTNDEQWEDLKGGGFLILSAVVSSLVVYTVAVVLITRWWIGA